MRVVGKAWVICLMIVGLIASTTPPVMSQEPMGNIEKGKAIFEKVCMSCHGINGQGDGPTAFFIGAYSSPRPQDLTAGIFKFRSTPSGELPTDEDLFRTVTNGVPGFMPPFVGLTADDRWHVVRYIKTFFPGFQEEEEVNAVAVGLPSTPSTSESISRGRKLYFQFECHSCHGANGRGESALYQSGELKDSLDLPIRPTDLTNPPSFKNGASSHALARAILTGMDGTPMPSFADTLENQDDVWHLVNFIRSLSTPSYP